MDTISSNSCYPSSYSADADVRPPRASMNFHVVSPLPVTPASDIHSETGLSNKRKISAYDITAEDSKNSAFKTQKSENFEDEDDFFMLFRSEQRLNIYGYPEYLPLADFMVDNIDFSDSYSLPTPDMDSGRGFDSDTDSYEYLSDQDQEFNRSGRHHTRYPTFSDFIHRKVSDNKICIDDLISYFSENPVKHQELGKKIHEKYHQSLNCSIKTKYGIYRDRFWTLTKNSRIERDLDDYRDKYVVTETLTINTEHYRLSKSYDALYEKHKKQSEDFKQLYTGILDYLHQDKTPKAAESQHCSPAANTEPVDGKQQTLTLQESESLNKLEGLKLLFHPGRSQENITTRNLAQDMDLLFGKTFKDIQQANIKRGLAP